MLQCLRAVLGHVLDMWAVLAFVLDHDLLQCQRAVLGSILDCELCRWLWAVLAVILDSDLLQFQRARP